MKLFLGGDICPTAITAPGFASGDLGALFGTVPALTAGADGFLVNLECAVTDRGRPIRKMGPNLLAPVETAQTLRALGVTDAGLSNNHTFDYGSVGLRDTMALLSQAGIRYTGVGENEEDARRPLYVSYGAVRTAVICVCEHEYSYALPDRLGTWGFDPFQTMEDIAAAKATGALVLVLYHGGKEQCEYPSPRLRRACQAMVRAGADAVFCQHSHCVGTRETYAGREILYGQGNFNFVNPKNGPQWLSGLLAELNYDAGKLTVAYHPVVTTDTGVTLAEGARREEILDGFAQRSERLLDGTWRQAWHDFCQENRAYYTAGITGNFQNLFQDFDRERLDQFFPHFLDCEAHTDVWRELFPSWHGAGTDEL